MRRYISSQLGYSAYTPTPQKGSKNEQMVLQKQLHHLRQIFLDNITSTQILQEGTEKVQLRNSDWLKLFFLWLQPPNQLGRAILGMSSRTEEACGFQLGTASYVRLRCFIPVHVLVSKEAKVHVYQHLVEIFQRCMVTAKGN